VRGVLPAAAAQVADQHRKGAPADRTGDVVDQERPVPQAGHARQPGDQDAQAGREPAEEHGPAALGGEVPLPPVEVATADEPADRPVHQLPPVPRADGIAHAVAQHGADDRDREHRGQ
jgi:hypothetical protein